MRRIAPLFAASCSLLIVAGCTDQRVTSPGLDPGDGYARLATAPCTECVYLTGSLAGKNSSQIQPAGGSYQTTQSGTHRGWLRGPAGTDFSLALERLENGRWRTAAKADVSGSSSESLSHNAGAGTYRWRVASKSGGGAYELWIQYPGAVVGPQVDTIVVAPESATLQVGQSLALSATAYDADGNVIAGAQIGWTSSNAAVAKVDAAGVVTGVAAGSATVTASSGGASTRVPVTVLASGGGGGGGTWTSVSTGQNHSCGVTSSGAGYCWGANMTGELGIGAIGDKRTPTLVAGGITWSHIDGGDDFSCGLATSGDAWCWGYAWHGQLGNGVLGGDRVLSPTRVVGGLKFSKVDAGNTGNYHTCALTASGAAYCWGNNSYGQLGNGQVTNPFGSASPVAVVGGRTYTQISVGRDFTCAIASGGALYCWGGNEVGQLGDGNGGPSVLRPQPVPVAGGRTWQAVATGDSHACGVTTAGEVFCWGQDQFGELGQGTAGVSSDVPVRVAANATFQAVGVGTYHSCAVSTAGTPWCWGYNEFGALGRGTKGSVNPHPTPAPVVGGVAFAGQLQGGYLHTCARSSDGRAFCWGYDGTGELGSEPDSEFCAAPGGEVGCRSSPWAVSSPGSTATRSASALVPSLSRGAAVLDRALGRLPARRIRFR
jgi:alpha-tubulin suppressor-like RCC1 family protein